ncbi:MAG: hypothetical protein O3A06_12360 [Proteobacteria bacterium]|nr:hypothetical protein [Pseudomonadota bacterium]
MCPFTSRDWGATLSRPDLPDRTLIWLLAGAAAVLLVHFALLRPLLPAAWRTPGSAELYLVGVAGALLLLVSLVFVLVKRSGRGTAIPAWFIAHVVCGTVGTVLVVVHSAGYLRQPPALLFLVLLALILLGLHARVRLSSRMAATFATKQRAFAPAGEVDRSRLARVIEEKRALLTAIDPQAREATFSPTLAHWLKTPRAAWRYARLAREESRLIGARASVGAEQAWWRPLHLALAAIFVFGLVVHVITVTFFAGYVADGGPITWWHLKDW